MLFRTTRYCYRRDVCTYYQYENKTVDESIRHTTDTQAFNVINAF